MLKINAYAKINLFLDVEGIRDDGFHDIVSYMQTVSLCDTLTLEKTNGEIEIVGNFGVAPESDLCYRAAKVFFEEYKINGGVKITLEKRIPMQGGLGGGSADAGATLRGLARLYGVSVTNEELASLGEKLGSDVPFCTVGGSKLTYGRGEILRDAPKLPSNFGIVIIAGKSGASTPAQFAALDRMYGNFKEKRNSKDALSRLCSAIDNGDLHDICGNMYNIFEETAAFDKEAVEYLKGCGAVGGMMTGSGSSAFCLFDSLEKAELAAQQLIQTGRKAFAAAPINDVNI